MVDPMLESGAQAPNCLECAHYYITWDKSFPYGCRAIGFKSKRRPQLDVLQNSGASCLSFESRPKAPAQG